MIIFDTESYDGPELSKFEGRMTDLKAKDGTYKSFSKAKKEVLTALKEMKKDVERQILELEAIDSPDHLELKRNPYTGYLRSLHGDMT